MSGLKDSWIPIAVVAFNLLWYVVLPEVYGEKNLVLDTELEKEGYFFLKPLMNSLFKKLF